MCTRIKHKAKETNTVGFTKMQQKYFGKNWQKGILYIFIRCLINSI